VAKQQSQYYRDNLCDSEGLNCDETVVIAEICGPSISTSNAHQKCIGNLGGGPSAGTVGDVPSNESPDKEPPSGATPQEWTPENITSYADCVIDPNTVPAVVFISSFLWSPQF
jgi:hypothetical protein